MNKGNVSGRSPRAQQFHDRHKKNGTVEAQAEPKVAKTKENTSATFPPGMGGEGEELCTSHHHYG